MVASILDSIKQMLGINSEDTNFDRELIIYINGALMIMTQLGVGPQQGFSITSNENTWVELLGDRNTDIGEVHTGRCKRLYCSIQKI